MQKPLTPKRKEQLAIFESFFSENGNLKLDEEIKLRLQKEIREILEEWWKATF